MKLNIFYDKNDLPAGYDFKLEYLFRYNGIELNYTDDIDEIDVLFLDYLNVHDLYDWEEQKIALKTLHNNECYNIALRNPKIPKFFIHPHELMERENYYAFLDFFSENLECDKQSIFLIDTLLPNRDGIIKIPLLTRIKQFNLQPNQNEVNRTKKFASLSNKSNYLRVKVFDSLIKSYDKDIDRLRSENVISFRNSNFGHDFEINPSNWYPTDDISFFKQMTSELSYPYEFYKSIGIPWMADDIDINPYIDMYNAMNQIYSNTFFSIVTETEDTWEKLSNTYTPFSEKVILPLLCGNLPFAIVDKKYYRYFEEAGFDFSYLFRIFGIDYLNNSVRKNFEILSTFINFLKNKTIDEVADVYNSVQDCVNTNQTIMENLINKIPSEQELKFIEDIKQLKYKL